MQNPKSPHPPVLSPSSSHLFSDVELIKPIRIKIKTSSTSTSPPTWKEAARQIEADTELRGNQSPPTNSDVGSPVAKQLDPRDRLVFGKIPMNESPDLISCSKCNRPITRNGISKHLESCVKEKISKKTMNDKDKVNGDGNGTPNGEIAVMPAKSKKRKHEDGESNGETTPPKKKPAKRDKDDPDPATKKEKKKKQKPTVAKPKLPVDVEKQCGVFDAEKGTMCARSLTCKSHSMSAKRAVLGRSQPYDTLLSQWQRKNQAKATTTQKAVVQQEAEDVDSEEEVRLVMQGVAKRYARPMEQRCIVGVRRKIRGMRMYEGLKGALFGAVQNISGSGVGRGRRQSQVAET